MNVIGCFFSISGSGTHAILSVNCTIKTNNYITRPET